MVARRIKSERRGTPPVSNAGGGVVASKSKEGGAPGVNWRMSKTRPGSPI